MNLISLVDEMKNRVSKYNARLLVLEEFIPLLMDENCDEFTKEKNSLYPKIEELNELIKIGQEQ
jgi:hypothetical protein